MKFGSAKRAKIEVSPRREHDFQGSQGNENRSEIDPLGAKMIKKSIKNMSFFDFDSDRFFSILARFWDPKMGPKIVGKKIPKVLYVL